MATQQVLTELYMLILSPDFYVYEYLLSVVYGSRDVVHFLDFCLPRSHIYLLGTLPLSYTSTPFKFTAILYPVRQKTE